MNTIEDLRTTLAAHADRADDPTAARSAAVRERVRRIRIRRAGAASAVVAAAVAVAGLAVLVPGLERVPAAGLPEKVTSQHFTYELADTEVFEVSADRRQVEMPTPSDGGAWGVVVGGTDLESGTATVYINAEPVLRIRGDERSAVYPIPSHAGGHITAKVDDAVDGGEVSLGLYEQTGTVASDSFGHAGRVFPATYGGARLIGGEFGDPDDTVVRYWFLATGRPVTVAPACFDPTGAFEVRYQLDGKDIGSGACSDESFDHSAAELAISNLWRPGELSPGRHAVTLVATRRDGSTGPPDDVAALFGIAVYEVGEQVRVGATDIDRVTDQNGRRWQVDQVIPISKTRAFSTEVATGDRPALVGFQTCGRTVTAYARSQSSGRRTDGSTSRDSTGGCGYTVGDELLAYDTYDVALEPTEDDPATSAEGRETFDGALVVYRPAD